MRRIAADILSLQRMLTSKLGDFRSGSQSMILLPTFWAPGRTFAASVSFVNESVASVQVAVHLREDPAHAWILPVDFRPLQCPMLWRGGRATAIPKPLKSSHSIEGWRSILLLENGSKAVSKALRGVLVAGYRRLQQEALCLPNLSKPAWHMCVDLSVACGTLAWRAEFFSWTGDQPSTQSCDPLCLGQMLRPHKPSLSSLRPRSSLTLQNRRASCCIH